jgi:hypothetical protein
LIFAQFKFIKKTESTDIEDGDDGEDLEDQETISNNSLNELDKVDLDEEDEDNYSAENNQSNISETAKNEDGGITSSSMSSMNSSLHIGNQMVPLSDQTNGEEDEETKQREEAAPEQHVDDENSDVETEDLVLLEPKLRDAYIKMRKLDKKLFQVLKKERKVRMTSILTSILNFQQNKN